MNHLLRKASGALEETVRATFERLPKANLRAALVGSGVQESRTPGMHMAEGARLGLDYLYATIDFDALGLTDEALVPVMQAAMDHGLAGLNITHPFKERILGCLDGLSAEAAAIGAVNTVVFDGGRAVGHNTDSWGFAESFRSAMADADLGRVLLLGAGGGGKAVADALVRLGAAEIDVFDIDATQAEKLAASLRDDTGARRAVAVDDPGDAAEHATGIVNATPVGMAKYPGMPLPAAALRPTAWVADIVYFPAETALLRAAAARGCRSLPGKGMAVFQAVRAFELIAGRRADPEAMNRHFDAQTHPGTDARLT